MKKTWEFWPSLMTKEAIAELEKVGCFPAGKGRPSDDETIPKPSVNEAVVFKNFFA